MNTTNSSSLCGSGSWRSSLQILSGVGILVSGLSVADYVIFISVILFSSQESVRKTLTISGGTAALFACAVGLPLSLLQMTMNSERKTLVTCLFLEAVQLTAMIEFVTSLCIYLIIAVVVLNNPLRQTFLQSTRGKCLVVGSSWLFGALVVVLPTSVILGIVENRHVTCCGWYLFPDAYIFTLIYGVLVSEIFIGFSCSLWFVYKARQKATEATNWVPLGWQKDPKAEVVSRRTRGRQVRWLATALFHFFISSATPFLLCLVYIHCPDCVHSELMLYIVNLFVTTGIVLVSLTSYIFEETRKTFKRLYIRCECRRMRVADV